MGSFGAGMSSLSKSNLIEILQKRVRNNQPTLAICLGLQLLCKSSEESPNVTGLNCISESIRALPKIVKRPQFGWNWIANENTSILGDGGYVYYANSYCLPRSPTGWKSGWTDYGHPFVGCLQRGAVVACQFHPELSGTYGSQILGRWLDLKEDL